MSDKKVNVVNLRNAMMELCENKPEWIPVESQLPPMFENVIVMGTLSAESHPNIIEARRWTGYSGPNAGRDEVGGIWEWLTPIDRYVKDVTVWFPKPTHAQ